jgi:hypothetical protein
VYRQVGEHRLGRIPFLRWDDEEHPELAEGGHSADEGSDEDDEGDEGEESDEGEGDEGGEGDEDDEDEGDDGDGNDGDEGDEVDQAFLERVRNRGPMGAARSDWPWEASAADRGLLDKIRDELKVWDAPSSQFRLPKHMTSHLRNLKIHDWICMCGSITAYMIMQCKGIGSDHKTLLIDFTYAIESITHKAYKRADIPLLKEKMAKCLADLEIMLPCYFSGTITRRQLFAFWIQVFTILFLYYYIL